MIHAYKDGKLVGSFDTLRDCCNTLKLEYTSASKHLSGEKYRTSAGGYLLFREKQTAEQIKIATMKLWGYNAPDGKLIQMFDILKK